MTVRKFDFQTIQKVAEVDYRKSPFGASLFFRYVEFSKGKDLPQSSILTTRILKIAAA